MPADGGVSATNKAGTKFGTGYCDAQCPKDIKFINGKANVEGWKGARHVTPRSPPLSTNADYLSVTTTTPAQVAPGESHDRFFASNAESSC
jgi:hypothetical protein